MKIIANRLEIEKYLETKEKYNNDNDWKSNPDLLAKITVNE